MRGRAASPLATSRRLRCAKVSARRRALAAPPPRGRRAPARPPRPVPGCGQPRGRPLRRARPAATLSSAVSRREGLHDLVRAGQPPPGDPVRRQPPEIRRPANDTSPVAFTRTAPITALMKVVLPAPFGPMSPRISPGYTSRPGTRRSERFQAAEPDRHAPLRREAPSRPQPAGAAGRSVASQAMMPRGRNSASQHDGHAQHRRNARPRTVRPHRLLQHLEEARRRAPGPITVPAPPSIAMMIGVDGESGSRTRRRARCRRSTGRVDRAGRTRRPRPRARTRSTSCRPRIETEHGPPRSRSGGCTGARSRYSSGRPRRMADHRHGCQWR